ncbi:MAG TPA: hypothetical protein VLA72_13965 [Anaerolineales bacterium]|nr:hypothetical protein [Anaerolineales bacterium]
MDTQRLSAIFLIAAFMTIILSTVINAPGLYQTQNIEERLQIIDTYRTRWLVNQALILVYSLFTIAGFLLLASVIGKRVQSQVLTLGAVALIAGTIAGLYFLYLQTTDPRGGYSGAYPIWENLAYWLWLAGIILFGVTFLQARLSAWLGYLTAGVAATYGIVFLITGAGFMTPFILGILQLIIGIVLLRQ